MKRFQITSNDNVEDYTTGKIILRSGWVKISLVTLQSIVRSIIIVIDYLWDNTSSIVTYDVRFYWHTS